MSLKETYIQYGVPSNWATDFEKLDISVATFKTTSKKNLINKYYLSEDQIKHVKNCIIRQPIDEKIIQKLLENNRFICCLCKGQKSDAYVIHHIKEYSLTKDNSYLNLAVLCPNDHDLAHRTGIALTNKISEKQIKIAKENWEKLVKSENLNQAKKKNIITKNCLDLNPFKELQSYTENDKLFFFGRLQEINELILKLDKYNIVGLFGESGTGKTSLINAGIIPNFKNQGFIPISIRCLDEPIKRIREQLIKVLKDEGTPIHNIEELATADTFAHLVIKLQNIILNDNKNIIIIIDQFEELFTRARQSERENLSKGINESLISTSQKKIFFLLSLREDYIGDLWDWAHQFNLEDAWIHQYRIKRLCEEKAIEAIAEPLRIVGIKVENEFIQNIVKELKQLGNGLIYPPYLQIVSSKLFEEYKKLNTTKKQTIEFGKNLLSSTESVESIIGDYLSETMLNGLTEEEKFIAQNILDLLTGPEGLRTFLDLDEISRYLTLKTTIVQHVLEHLIKKKIVHPIVQNDIVNAYELVHDFLSKKFFDKLGPDAQKSKTILEIFRKAFKEWKQHNVLASKDRLEIMLPSIEQLSLNEEEWTFLLKSSFSIYWYFENQWTSVINADLLLKICISLLSDKEIRIVENAISTMGRTKNKVVIPYLIKIIESPTTDISIKDTAIFQFSFNFYDENAMPVLKQIIQNSPSVKLRKSAVNAFGRSINLVRKSEKDIVSDIKIIIEALDDPMTNVRKQAADVLAYNVIRKESVKPLIDRIKKEKSIISKKAMIYALGVLLFKNYYPTLIVPLIQAIYKDSEEDYRVIEEARQILEWYKKLKKFELKNFK